MFFRSKGMIWVYMIVASWAIVGGLAYGVWRLAHL
jgi:hypothetical protein